MDLDTCLIPAAMVDARQPDQPLIYVNPAFERLTGYAAAEVIGRNCRFLQGDDQDQPSRHDLRRCLRAGQAVTVILRNYRKDGTPFLNELSVNPLRAPDGTITHYVGYAQDVTSRVRLQAIADCHPDPLMSFDHDWTMTYVNAAAAANAGVPPEAMIGQTLVGAYPEVIGTPPFEAARRARETGTSQQVITHLAPIDRMLRTTAYPTDGDVTVMLHDVTDERTAALNLQASQEKFAKVFQVSPVPIFITRLADGMFVDANPAFLHLTGYATEDLIGVTAPELYADPADRATLLHLIHTHQPVEDHRVKYKVKSGAVREATIAVLPVDLAGEPCIVSMLRDALDDPTTLEQLTSSAQHANAVASELKRALDTSLDMITVLDQERRFVSVSLAAHRLLGYWPDELVGRSYVDFVHPDDRARSEQGSKDLRARRSLSTFQNRFVRKDGSSIWLDWTASRQPDGLTFAVARDVTEHRAAVEDQAFLAAIVQASPDAIIGLTVDGTIRAWNGGAERMYGYAAAEMIGQQITAIVPDDLIEEERQLLARAAQGQYVPAIETVRLSRTGARIPVQLSVAPIFDQYGEVIGASKIAQDISDRHAAERQITQLNTTLQRKLDHLMGLRAIDQSIASSLDLTATLGTVLDQVMTQVNVDAATALVLDPHLLTLSPAATRGVPPRNGPRSAQRLGQGLAGQVALTRQPQTLDARNATHAGLIGQDWTGADGWAACSAVPLIAKGKVLGVIEVFRRQPFDPESDWFETLLTLAGQAAIAVENTQLFLNLERNNLELALAYQETIEGWAQALDLRDKETEGHSRRVTDLTVRLCRELGVPATDLIHVQRGALLHDIGKMGVADAILLKPGPLTEAEWVEMRKHPGYAAQLLKPIHYLKQALDIPQYHHEKWDGSGYPHGLTGSEIPLTARAFAVVDVYDALTNDRPYRAAWTKERAVAYLHEQAGRHFDPAVVATFVKLLGATGPTPPSSP